MIIMFLFVSMDIIFNLDGQFGGYASHWEITTKKILYLY